MLDRVGLGRAGADRS